MTTPPATGHRRETELLLAGVRAGLDPGRAGGLPALLGAEVDWPFLIRTALAHGTLPLLYRGLCTARRDEIPGVVLDELRRHVHATAWYNLVRTRELVQILGLLRAHGVAALALKGPALAAAVYGDVSLRPFSDLDILVRPPDALRARRLLIAQGYRPDANLTDREAADLLNSPREHHFLLQHGPEGIPVELHWRLTQECFAFPFDAEALWGRLVPVRLGEATVPGLRGEDWLLLLSAHGAKHAWSQLRLIADLDAVLGTHSDLDWGWVLHQARLLGSERMLWLGLLLARELLGTALPAEVLSRAQADRTAEALAGEVRAQLFREDPGSPSLEDDWGFYLRTRERWTDRVRVCLGLEEIPPRVDRTVLPRPTRWLVRVALALRPNQRDREFLALPKPLAFLYYLIRPFRLLGKRSRTWWRASGR